MLTLDGPQFLAIKCIVTEIKPGLLNNSVYLNLLCFKLLSRESEAEHHAAHNVVDWSAPVIESIFGYRKFTRQVSFKCQLTLLGDVI